MVMRNTPLTSYPTIHLLQLLFLWLLPMPSSFTSFQFVPKNPIFLQCIPLIFELMIFPRLTRLIFKCRFNVPPTCFCEVGIWSITLKHLIHIDFTKDSSKLDSPKSSSIWVTLFWFRVGIGVHTFIIHLQNYNFKVRSEH